MEPEQDERWMRRCLTLAAQGAGAVSPNPMVGAVLVDPAGQVLGEGWHEAYGGPHAEVHAVREAEKAGAVLHEATLYVNLEPCSHHGKTPPCADLILEKGISKVVVGMMDPFPEVAGRGLERLRAQGVEVQVGVLEAACKRLNEAFVHHVLTGRPLVTLKIAQTLDGRIATQTGDSRWVSGVASRRLVHTWRSQLDGVLVARGTAARDDPSLTVRHVAGRQPERFVLDPKGALLPTLKLFTDAFAPHTTAIIGPHARPAYAASLRQAGGRLLQIPESEGRLDLHALFERLGRDGGREGRSLQSVLVEAGPGLATALLAHDLVDRFFLFIAPKVLGGGIPALDRMNINLMKHARTFAEHQWEPVGEDMLFRGYRQRF